MIGFGLFIGLMNLEELVFIADSYGVLLLMPEMEKQ